MLNRLHISVENQLHLFAGTMNLTLALVYMAIPVRATMLGATPLELGFLGGTTPAVYVCLAILTGRLSDRISPKSMMIASLAIYIPTFALMMMTTSIRLMVLLMIPAGISLALCWPPLEGWLGAGHPPLRVLLKRLGYFNIAWCTGQFIGPAVAGYLYNAAFWFPYVLNLALAGLILLALLNLPNVRTLPLPNPGNPEPLNHAGNPGYIYAGWLANFLSYFAIASLRALFPKLAIETAIPIPLIGILLAVPMLVELVMFAVLRIYHGWHYRIFFLVGMQVMAGLGLSGLYFGTSPAFFALCLAVLGAFAGLAYYSSIYYTLAGRSDTGGGAGLHETIIGIGFATGPLLSGLIARWAGLRMPYLVITVMMVLAAVSQLIMVSRGRTSSRIEQH
jgi:MFS family permease